MKVSELIIKLQTIDEDSIILLPEWDELDDGHYEELTQSKFDDWRFLKV